MRMLAAMPEVARSIGARAGEHIETHHALEAVGEQYWNALAHASTAKAGVKLS
jgi:hypothetical protein